jgi:hypothetical protein
MSAFTRIHVSTAAVVRLFRAAAAALALSACGAAAASPVSDWNAIALTEVRASNLGPPVVARALAIAHTCMYDAWSAYDPVAVGTAIDPALRRPVADRSDRNKAMAVSFAAYRCLLNLFPAGASRLSAAMVARGYDPTYVYLDGSTPAGIGNAAAAAVIGDRAHDGANQYGDLRPGAYADYTFYKPRNELMPFCGPTTATCRAAVIASPSTWQPLIAESGKAQTFAAAHWGKVRPFGFKSATELDGTMSATAKSTTDNGATSVSASIASPQPFAQYDGPAAAAEALYYSRLLNPQTKLIVEYWADGPSSELPPGHWGVFAQFVSLRNKQSIDDDAKMFFVMHSASMDAGIAAWYLKRKFDGVRPITVVRYWMNGQQVQAWGGAGRRTDWVWGDRWSPYNPGSNLTPAFPGYVSGHSAFSWASAIALQLFKGDDCFNYSTVIPPNFGRVEPGIPAVATTISFATFSDAATQAGLSRLLGGIHFREDIDDGQVIGKIMGAKAWNRAQRLFAGQR